MGHYGVKRSNVVETELSECALQDLNPSFFRCLMSSSRIDRLDDFVNLGRNQGIGQLKEVKLQDADNNGDLRLFQHFLIVHLAVVQCIAKTVCCLQGNVMEPDGTTCLVSFKFGVTCNSISTERQYARIVNHLRSSK